MQSCSATAAGRARFPVAITAIASKELLLAILPRVTLFSVVARFVLVWLLSPSDLPLGINPIGELSGSDPMEMADVSGVKQNHDNGAGHSPAAKESGYALNELIVALMRKGALTEEEGKTMLLRLLHHDFLP